MSIWVLAFVAFLDGVPVYDTSKVEAKLYQFETEEACQLELFATRNYAAVNGHTLNITKACIREESI